MMSSDTFQTHFSLIEKIPPSADLHLAATPFLPPPRTQSPIRRQRSPQHELGPYLRDLEPSLILEALIAKNDAFAAHDYRTGDGTQNRQAFIRNAVAGASPAEREWGIKAAKASKSIREWYDELTGWPWTKLEQTNGFGAQYYEDQFVKTLPPTARERSRSSIPSSEIRGHEMRVEDIKKDLGMLELEDLKGYVRDVHVTPNSKRTPQESVPDAASYEHMDDFQAIIIAAILQSLPTLARLNGLINTWSLRLVVMRLIPEFMRDMACCKDSMISAQMAIGGLISPSPFSSPRDSTTSSQRKSFSRNVFEDIKAVLKDQISETGRKLDALLDLLEGSADVLPEQWIDSMDELEEQQRLWAKKAEEVVQDYESHHLRALSTNQEQNGKERNSRGSQFSKPSSRDSGALSSLPDEFDREAVGTTAPWPAMSTSDDSDISNTYMITAPLVRNVSVGVRKPTGVPQASDYESTELTVATKEGEPSSEHEAINDDCDSPLDLVSNRSRSGSVDSDSISIGSSPEIQSATLAAYPGSPIQVTTPASSRPSVDYLNISQLSDLHNPRSRKSWSGMPSDARFLKHERKRSSTFTASASPSPGHDSFLQPGHALPDFSPDHARPRSASIKSFEIVPRSEVRTIEVRRNRDSALSLQNLARDGQPLSPISKVDHIRQDSDPSGSSSEASLLNLTNATDRFMPDEFPTSSHTELGSQMPKADHVTTAKTRSPLEKGSFAASRIPRASPQQRSATMNNLSFLNQSQASLSNGDRLDAKISTILTNIPANIRLTSSTEAATSAHSVENSVFTKSRASHLSRLSVSRLLRPKHSTPTTPPTILTRAATSISSEPRNNSGSDIKLYHLHQPGTASPIKLYIRLVGDTGERVMVRVGGGWADLGEYLKEYASHHGKRAVSDNHFNILNIPLPSSSSSSPANSRPSSSSSAALHRQITTPNTTTGTITTGDTTASVALSSNPPFPPRTPPSFGSSPLPNSASTSRKQTWSANGAGASTSDTDGSPTPGLGLAGPKSRNVNISPRKQAWVDGMMRQARRTSVGGSDRPGSAKGVKGGVRRVFLGRSVGKE